MMLGAKGLLPPLIPDCSALRALTILKNIRNPLIFLRKMASYSCFWRVPRLKIFMQASLHQISNLLTLVSLYQVTIYPFCNYNTIMFCGQEKILYDLLYYIVQKIKFLTAAERFLSDTRILLNKKDVSNSGYTLLLTLNYI